MATILLMLGFLAYVIFCFHRPGLMKWNTALLISLVGAIILVESFLRFRLEYLPPSFIAFLPGSARTEFARRTDNFSDENVVGEGMIHHYRPHQNFLIHRIDLTKIFWSIETYMLIVWDSEIPLSTPKVIIWILLSWVIQYFSHLGSLKIWGTDFEK